MQEYYLENYDETEKELLEFLLKNADTVRLTKSIMYNAMPRWLQWVPFVWLREDKGTNEAYKRTLARLKKDHLRRQMTDTRFNNIPQGKGDVEHHFYRLSQQMKQLLRKETLTWSWGYEHTEWPFYGLEDPTFYRKGKMLCCVITHEHNMAYLYLTPSDRRNLEKKGMKLFNMTEARNE